MFENKKAIICDLDGTLIDSIGMWNDVDRDLISTFNKKPHDTIGIERTRYLANNNTGNIYEKYMSYLISTYDISKYSAEDLLKLRNQISRDYMLNKLKLKEYADMFLLNAYNKGYKLILATSSSNWAIDLYKNNVNLNASIDFMSMFHKILTSDNVRIKKPNPAIYNEAIKYAECPKSEIIAIEDELVGVEAAICSGIDVISIYDKYSDVDRELINSMATYSVNDYYTLTKKL